MTLGEDVAVADVQCAIKRSVLGRLGVRAAHRNADNKDHKADQDGLDLPHPVVEHSALTCMKHALVTEVRKWIVD